VGSQLDSTLPLREATRLLAEFAQECLEAGAPLRSIDPGGGWPMAYGAEETPFPAHREFGVAIEAGIADAGMQAAGLEVVTEPGRALVGDAGILLVRVLAEKRQGGRRFVIVDGAMTELVRPALYGAHHAVMPVMQHEGEWSAADVVGPVCESGDFLAQGRPLPPVERGDLLAIRGAGAYGREMSSTYNGRPAAREILVDGATTRTVRRRASIASLWAQEEM
jgi:diaminopimelate decarboxylase